MSGKNQTLSKKALRKSVYRALNITEASSNQSELIGSLLSLQNVEHIAKIVRLFPAARQLPDTKVREILTQWYPTEASRTSNLSEECRMRFFHQEWVKTDVLPISIDKVVKQTRAKTPAPPKFVALKKGFNPERPYRSSSVSSGQTVQPTPAESAVHEPVIDKKPTIFTAHFIQLMKAQIPATQQLEFRMFALKNRRRGLKAEQYIQEWIKQNPQRVPVEAIENTPEKLHCPAIVTLQATGSRRTVYQRDVTAQASFRRRLFMLWGGKCAIEGLALAGVLEAAHISHGDDFSDDNGILMTPTMHALFDRHLVGIEPTTLTVHVSPLLPDLSRFDGLQLTPPVPLNTANLTLRWQDYLHHLERSIIE